jgi:hypothetical protein
MSDSSPVLELVCPLVAAGRWAGDANELTVRLRVDDGTYAGSSEDPIEREALLAFAAALQAFPSSAVHQLMLRSSAAELSTDAGFRLRAHVTDRRGNTALDVTCRNGANSVTVVLPWAPSVLDRLGRELAAWLSAPETAFRFSP